MNLGSFLAQSDPTFWSRPPQSGELYMWLVIALVFASGVAVALSFTPSPFRRKVVWFFTFLAGFVYVAKFLWPTPIAFDSETELPSGPVEQFGVFLGEAIDPVATIANVMGAFLLGLGIYSLVRVHLNKIRRRQKDWGFSTLLLSSFLIMLVVGFWDWILKKFNDPEGRLILAENWGPVNVANDLLFDGLYQQMDAAMFSIIAFFILSAAFRAFRIRSVEATVMMTSALILMLNLMGFLTFHWGNAAEGLALATGNPVFENLSITVVADWLRANMQVPAIRAIEFGVGLGALAMGLRIWLGLEKGGISA